MEANTILLEIVCLDIGIVFDGAKFLWQILQDAFGIDGASLLAGGIERAKVEPRRRIDARGRFHAFLEYFAAVNSDHGVVSFGWWG